MPATRLQRQRVLQRRHVNLPDELVRKIIEIAGPYCCLVKGGQACSFALRPSLRAGRTVKSYISPVSNNLLRVPEDHDSIADAVAAAKDGDTILVEDEVWEIDKVIAVPPIRLQIVGVGVENNMPYGTKRTPRGELDHEPHCYTPVIVGSFDHRDGGVDTEDGGIFWVEGAGAQLTLRSLAFVGLSNDWDDVEEDEEVELDGHDTAICALQGSRVTLENCWFSQFGRVGLRAQSGARMEARDCTFNRSFFGAISEGPGSSVVLRNVDFQGANKYACMADEGGRMDLKACRVRCAEQSGFVAKDPGSRLRFDASTQFVSRRKRREDQHPADHPPPWAPRAVAVDGASLTFPDKLPGVQRMQDSDYRAWLCEGRDDRPDDQWESDVEWESDAEDAGDTRWLTVRTDLNGPRCYETGHERCMNQEGWLLR